MMNLARRNSAFQQKHELYSSLYVTGHMWTLVPILSFGANTPPRLTDQFRSRRLVSYGKITISTVGRRLVGRI